MRAAQPAAPRVHFQRRAVHVGRRHKRIDRYADPRRHGAAAAAAHRRRRPASRAPWARAAPPSCRPRRRVHRGTRRSGGRWRPAAGRGAIVGGGAAAARLSALEHRQRVGEVGQAERRLVVGRRRRRRGRGGGLGGGRHPARDTPRHRRRLWAPRERQRGAWLRAPSRPHHHGPPRSEYSGSVAARTCELVAPQRGPRVEHAKSQALPRRRHRRRRSRRLSPFGLDRPARPWARRRRRGADQETRGHGCSRTRGRRQPARFVELTVSCVRRRGIRHRGCNSHQPRAARCSCALRAHGAGRRGARGNSQPPERRARLPRDLARAALRVADVAIVAAIDGGRAQGARATAASAGRAGACACGTRAPRAVLSLEPGARRGGARCWHRLLRQQLQRRGARRGRRLRQRGRQALGPARQRHAVGDQLRERGRRRSNSTASTSR